MKRRHVSVPPSLDMAWQWAIGNGPNCVGRKGTGHICARDCVEFTQIPLTGLVNGSVSRNGSPTVMSARVSRWVDRDVPLPYLTLPFSSSPPWSTSLESWTTQISFLHEPSIFGGFYLELIELRTLPLRSSNLDLRLVAASSNVGCSEEESTASPQHRRHRSTQHHWYVYMHLAQVYLRLVPRIFGFHYSVSGFNSTESVELLD